MLVIFPFEDRFYRARGVNAEFVGHPLATLPLPAISREAYAAESRPRSPPSSGSPFSQAAAEKELDANISAMVEAARQLLGELPSNTSFHVASHNHS